MGKSAWAAYSVMQFSKNNPELFFSILIWLVLAAIDTAIFAAISAVVVAGFSKTKFTDAFGPLCIIIGIIHVIVALFVLFS